MLKSIKGLVFGAASTLLLAGVAHADITVYTAGPQSLIDKLAEGFTAQSGIKVNVFQATTGKIMARIEAEAANPAVDVLISASWETATDFAKRGWLVSYTSPNAEKVPDFLKNETAVAQGVSALGIAWNTKSGTPKPAEWSDLAKPEFKDLVNIPDPAQSGSSFELTAALAGQDDFALFKSLKDNGAIIAGANAEALNPVLQGAKGAVFGAVDYITFGNKAKGESIDVVFPESGTVIAPRPVMILNWSKNQDEAKKFVDYMLSDEGQKLVAGTYLMPARSDIPADRPLISDLKLIDYDAAAIQGKRKEILQQISDIFGAN
ncbi:iron(III) transport system substrate-binding protein [Aquamicrobium lusatiense]|uniref:Iron(III) transport system substrate-binding protein n=1 Tax=Aquamicrobium lusatiense TaxID=89772 RepID=A0A7W9S503_9HYPH|nr:ABC transporter substrate-binding protein [Aquamicrobium lusatiense]MBB6014217.1 iron(III) transport system substrate-binding protein [Aquamicrobium lusatiense]